MPAISASAPGKIILFGEHAVVYGKPAIAAPVTQVTAKAIITPLIGKANGAIEVQAPEIRLEGPLKDIPLDHALSQAISMTLKTIGISNPPPFNIQITSTIPLAAGLGSGAAVTVAIIQAVAGFIGKPLNNQAINEIAFEIEKLHHGTPSGIDNTVISHGRMVYFVKHQPIETFTVKNPFTIVIGDTGIKTPTSVPVGQVRQSWQADPDTFYEIFDACGAIAEQGKHVIETGQIGNLGLLMNENHDWLVKMGVSSPELDRLTEAARQAGAAGAKLSGGGMGGNMIALANEDNAEEIANALLEAGATHTIITTIA